MRRILAAQQEIVLNGSFLIRRIRAPVPVADLCIGTGGKTGEESIPIFSEELLVTGSMPNISFGRRLLVGQSYP